MYGKFGILMNVWHNTFISCLRNSTNEAQGVAGAPTPSIHKESSFCKVG